MRITIDTDLQAIIVPDSYYMQVVKLFHKLYAEHGSYRGGAAHESQRVHHQQKHQHEGHDQSA